MSRFSQHRLNEEADYFDRQAKRSDAHAASGDQAASNPNLNAHTQGIAARCADIARSNARESRNIASALRDGEIPDSVQLD